MTVYPTFSSLFESKEGSIFRAFQSVLAEFQAN